MSSTNIVAVVGAVLVSHAACSPAEEAPRELAEGAAAIDSVRSLLPTAADVASPPEPAERYALLIGISAYPDPQDSLPGPVTDVAEMRALLRTFKVPRENVRVLINEEATRDAVLAEIQTHLGKAGPTGLALLYFAGHGARLQENYSVQDDEPTSVDQAFYVWGRSKRKATIILDDELAHLFRGLRAGRIVAIVDACFSGTAVTVTVGAERGDGDAAASELRDQALPSGSAPESWWDNVAVRSVDQARRGPDMELPGSFISDTDPAVSPANESGDLAELAPYALLAATRDTREAYSMWDWPQGTREQHGVFTYFVTRLLKRTDLARTPSQLMSQMRGTIRNDPLCTESLICQAPQASGVHSNTPLVNLLGRR